MSNCITYCMFRGIFYKTLFCTLYTLHILLVRAMFLRVRTATGTLQTVCVACVGLHPLHDFIQPVSLVNNVMSPSFFSD